MDEQNDTRIHDLTAHRLSELFDLLLQERYADAGDILRSARLVDPQNIYLIALDKQLERLRAFAADPRGVTRKNELLQSVPALIQRAAERFRVRTPQPAEPPAPVPEAGNEERREAVEKLKKRYFQHADEHLRNGDYDAALVEIRRVFILEPENRVARQYEQTIRQLKGVPEDGGASAEPPVPAREAAAAPAISSTAVSATGGLLTVNPATPLEPALPADGVPAAADEATSGLPDRAVVFRVLAGALLIGALARGGVAVYELLNEREMPAVVEAVQETREDQGARAIPVDRRPLEGPSKAEFLEKTSKADAPADEVRRNEEGKIVEGPDEPEQAAAGDEQPQPADPQPALFPADPAQLGPARADAHRAADAGEAAHRTFTTPAPVPRETSVPKSGSGLEGLPIMTPAAMVRPASPQVSRLRASSVSAGDVTLRVKVDETGSPVQATVLQSADARLNTAAMDAVLQSGFTPARTAEGNVTSWVVVTVRVDPDR